MLFSHTSLVHLQQGIASYKQAVFMVHCPAPNSSQTKLVISWWRKLARYFSKSWWKPTRSTQRWLQVNQVNANVVVVTKRLKVQLLDTRHLNLKSTSISNDIEGKFHKIPEDLQTESLHQCQDYDICLISFLFLSYSVSPALIKHKWHKNILSPPQRNIKYKYFIRSNIKVVIQHSCQPTFTHLREQI